MMTFYVFECRPGTGVGLRVQRRCQQASRAASFGFLASCSAAAFRAGGSGWCSAPAHASDRSQDRLDRRRILDLLGVTRFSLGHWLTGEQIEQAQARVGLFDHGNEIVALAEVDITGDPGFENGLGLGLTEMSPLVDLRLFDCRGFTGGQVIGTGHKYVLQCL